MSAGPGKIARQLWVGYAGFLLFWGALCYNWIAQQIILHKFFASLDADNRPLISDFALFYSCGQMAADCLHKPIDIYSIALQAQYAAKVTAPVVAEHPFYLQYPPYLFSALIPLTYFDILGAYLLWCTLSLTALAFACLYLLKAASTTDMPPGKFTRAFLFIATFAALPTWYSVRLGQTSLFLVPCLAAFWLASMRRRYFLAGLAAGISLVKLQYLPPVFMIGVILGGIPFIGGYATIGMLLLALSYFTVGAENILRFPHALLNGETGKDVAGVAADQMQNLRGMLTLFLGGENPIVPVVSLLVFALSLMAMLVAWWHFKKKLAAGPEAGRYMRVLASISTLLMLIASPHCHIQDYLALVIPCYWLWLSVREDSFASSVAPSDRLMQRLIVGFPIVGWVFFIVLFVFQLVKIQPFFIWACLITALAVKYYLKLNGRPQSLSASKSS